MRGSVWEMIWMGVGSIGAAFGKGVCCQCVIGLAALVMKSVPCLTEKQLFDCRAVLPLYLLKRCVTCQFAG